MISRSRSMSPESITAKNQSRPGGKQVWGMPGSYVSAMTRSFRLAAGLCQASSSVSMQARWARWTPRRASASTSPVIGGGAAVHRSHTGSARRAGSANGSGPRAMTSLNQFRASTRRSRICQYQTSDRDRLSASCSSRSAMAWRRAVRRFSYSRSSRSMAASCRGPRSNGSVVRASSR